MRVLFLSRWYPYPPDNGAKSRIFNLIRALSQRHQVHLISFASEAVDQSRLDAMREFCQRILTVPYRPFRPDSSRALAGFLSPQPRSVVDTFSPELQALVTQAVRELAFDVVIASEIDLAPYAVDLPVPFKVLEELELAALFGQLRKATAPLRKARASLMWWKASQYVARLVRNFDLCTVASEAERDLVRRVAGSSVPLHVVPNGVDVAACRLDYGPPSPDSLIYSGALTYSANFDAMAFFLDTTFPLIRAARPAVTLAITGGLDGVNVKRLSHVEGVTLTGYLPDVRPAVAGSWASVVPLREGGGSRVKILEAMALGTPVVSTSKGVEGLNVRPSTDLLVADTPAEFADQVLRLLASPELRQSLSQHARQTVETRYDWAQLGAAFDQLVVNAAQRRPWPQKGTGAYA